MKIITALTCVCLFFINESCNKDAYEKKLNNLIEGKWELRQISSDEPSKLFEPGNGNLLYFTSGSFKKYTSGQLADSGTYSIIHDATALENVCLTIPDNKYQNRIVFNKTQSPKQFFQISNDSLYFLSGCFATDGGVSLIYVRKP